MSYYRKQTLILVFLISVGWFNESVGNHRFAGFVCGVALGLGATLVQDYQIERREQP